MKQAKAIVAL